jgi:hypothetical protein
MECLHKLPAGTTENEEWICEQKPNCHFICKTEERHIYENAMIAFRATEQPQPVCCDNNLAKFRVVIDIMKDNYGRPFFVCSKNTDKCDYFEWGDKTILQRPLCYHNEVSKKRSVTKSGPNKGRVFFSCPRQRGDVDQCKFFQWEDETAPPTTAKTPPPATDETQPPTKKRNTTPEKGEEDIRQFHFPRRKNKRTAIISDDEEDIPSSQHHFPRRKNKRNVIISDEEE